MVNDLNNTMAPRIAMATLKQQRKIAGARSCRRAYRIVGGAAGKEDAITTNIKPDQKSRWLLIFKRETL